MLQPGANKTVEFDLSVQDRSVWDAVQHEWREVKGVFKWEIGKSSADPQCRGTFTSV
jgi:hypothetical protein